LFTFSQVGKGSTSDESSSEDSIDEESEADNDAAKGSSDQQGGSLTVAAARLLGEVAVIDVKLQALNPSEQP
jgi:hypothetical protein